MSVVATSLPVPAAVPRPAVHKFGGSSLANAEGIRRCVNIIADESADRSGQRLYIVVSAARGVTDALLALAATAARSDDWQANLAVLQQRQHDIASRLLDSAPRERFNTSLLTDVARLQNILAACNTLRVTVPQAYDEVAAYGELWSMRLFAAALEMRALSVALLDARDFLRVDGRGETPQVDPQIDWERSNRLFAASEPQLRQQLVIVPGYIARCAHDASTVTLGRNGSDWSATILGRLANASTVTIWSDVAGVLEADPDIVPDARPHAVIGRAAATRLAEAGARILHPATLAPLHDTDVHVHVRNSFDAQCRGTLILPSGEIPGTVISTRTLDDNRVAVTAVGSGPLLQQAASALANTGIGYADARSDGGSLRIDVARDDAVKTQRVLHRALCRRQRALSVLLFGTGNVGSEVLRQLAAATFAPLRLLGVANSRAMLFDASGLPPDTALARLRSAGTASDANDLAARLLKQCESAPVIIDATASTAIAERHAAWRGLGIHVVTANKLALSNGWVSPSADDNSFYGDAATVGAGLPVLSAIRRLRAAGDTVTRVEGVLSGSLAYLFHALQQDVPYSQAVLAAQRDGLAEPDPRQDLSGADVARKLRIIANAAGLADIAIPQPESLLSAPVANLPLEDFLVSLPKADDEWRQRVASAHRQGKVLRYVASLNSGTEASIGMCALRSDDALAQTRSTDNCVNIYSHTYANEPLVIRGPGAGARVTATALLADVAEVLVRYGR